MVIKYKNRYINFSDAKIGDFFIYKNDLYLKLAPAGNDINAFNCETESLECIDSLSLIDPINIVLQEV